MLQLLKLILYLKYSIKLYCCLCDSCVQTCMFNFFFNEVNSRIGYPMFCLHAMNTLILPPLVICRLRAAASFARPLLFSYPSYVPALSCLWY